YMWGYGHYDYNSDHSIPAALLLSITIQCRNTTSTKEKLFPAAFAFSEFEPV
ncbi:hypothetical protein J6590_099267, partial [Homalodisca vitripennis]